MIITKKEFDYIKNKKEKSFTVKVNFGEKEIKVVKTEKEAVLEDRIHLNLRENIREGFCYLIDNEGVKKIAFFSSQTNRFYKLLPTQDWPSVCIGSVPMHKIISPKKDTQNKINLLKPYGYVLDTCTGLGYTAILASKYSTKVITFEKDENILFLARLNPLSKQLFESPKIKIREEDIKTGIKNFEDNYFDCIIHDPPTFKLAPELYSISFYQQLLRVLKKKGKMFHYAPLYKIRRKFDFPSRIKIKLKEAGFKIIEFSQTAGGFLCSK
jgi:hypothetical protein